MNGDYLKFDAAYRKVIDKLISNGFKQKNTILINSDRYCIVVGESKTVLITFKKELFHNFGEMFINKYSDEEGDTINCLDLKISLRYDVKEIYTVFPDGTVYIIPFMEFMEKSHRWINKEGKDVRSVSINNYKKAFEV
jgi:hypothetical protein